MLRMAVSERYAELGRREVLKLRKRPSLKWITALRR